LGRFDRLLATYRLCPECGGHGYVAHPAAVVPCQTCGATGTVRFWWVTPAEGVMLALVGLGVLAVAALRVLGW